MKLAEYGELYSFIEHTERFDESMTRYILDQVLEGIKYLHSNGIVHRDIKPENLLMDAQGYVRITDLGISREWTPDNSQDTSGTPGYMAPEVMCR